MIRLALNTPLQWFVRCLDGLTDCLGFLLSQKSWTMPIACLAKIQVAVIIRTELTTGTNPLWAS